MKAPSARPTAAMAEAAREGLALHDAGFSGPGLVRSTLERAEEIARREPLPASWWRRMAAWHARHGAAPLEAAARRRVTSPARVAWLLWGGGTAATTARQVLGQLSAPNPRKGEGEGPAALRGLDARAQYEALRWGRRPRSAFTVDSTSPTSQALVELGKLRSLFLVTVDGEDVGELRPRRPYPTLAVGAVDNRLYVVGGSTLAMSRSGDWGQPGRHNLWIRRTDYEARKGPGAELVYWYHDHERPFPRYEVTRDGRPHFHGGGYHVEPAGIVG